MIPCQALLSVGFPRKEYWSELPFPFPEDCLGPGIEPTSPALASWFFTTEPPGTPLLKFAEINFFWPYSYTLTKLKIHLVCSVNLTLQKFLSFICEGVIFPPILLKAVWRLLCVTAFRFVRTTLSSTWSPLALCVSSLQMAWWLFSPKASLGGIYSQKQSNCALSWSEKWMHFEIPWV